VYHSHQSEEEWLYILSSRGIAEIDGEEIDSLPALYGVPHTFGPAPFEESFRSGSDLPHGW
jgi:hypothetical protein